ncbi:MAG: AAA family ATPase [Sandaracinaceae bacterium]|nr:AAA family ATPase [Sandaracinaceae bacterium]
MVLGKFYPPHRGHVYLCEFAAAHVERLHVVVGTLARETIPGGLRHAWMCELVPQAHVHHLRDENPQDPSEHPEFWSIWRASLRRVLPEPVDLVFASEPYGARLAQELGARFVPVDIDRSALGLSGSAVRADPLAAWGALPRVVRPYFVRRVCLVGPESTGKTTLARTLARSFDTAWVPEYARAYLAQPRVAPGGALASTEPPPLVPDDFVHIARGQAASEEALAREARKVLVCDSDALTTALYAHELVGTVPAEVAERADTARYDLTLLTAPDVPFVPDPQRFLPHTRQRFFDRCRAELEARGRAFVVLRGAWDERLATAQAAVDALLSATRP